MGEMLSLFFAAALTGHLALDYLLGVCPLLALSRRPEAAAGMALATLIVLPLFSVLAYVLDHWLLQPLQIEYLQLLVMVAAFAALAGAAEAWLRRRRPALHLSFGVFLPLLNVNCLVLGAALLTLRQADSFAGALMAGAGAAAGYGLVLLMFACLRERLAAAPVPAPFQGAPVALITLGLMAMGWMGLKGL